MKSLKSLSLIAIIVFLSNTSMAQSTIGIKAGIGGSTQSEYANIYDNQDIVIAYNIGLSARHSFNDWFSLKGDLIFSQRGKSVENSNEGETSTKNIHLQYLNIPFKAEFSTIGNYTKVFLASGPYISYLINSDTDNSTTISSEDYNKLDYGLEFEIGSRFPIADREFEISLTYDMGFAEINSIENQLRNKTLTLNFIYLF